MKNVCLFLAGMALALGSLAQDNTKLAHPESVNTDGEYLYVTNVGKPLDPTAKDSNGYISRFTLDGKLIDSSITNIKLNAPKGTAVIRGVLYVADIDKIIGIQVSNGRKIVEISLANTKTKFANDLVVKDDFTLFVSATDIGKVLQVNIRLGNVRPVADVKGANGLAYDKAKNKLYVCGFDFNNLAGGEVGVISWKGYAPSYEKISEVKGAFDGLALLDDHTLAVSDWVAMDKPSGIVQKIDLNTKQVSKIDWPAINGPADFYYDVSEKKFYIPEMLSNQILIKQ